MLHLPVTSFYSCLQATWIQASFSLYLSIALKLVFWLLSALALARQSLIPPIMPRTAALAAVTASPEFGLIEAT